VYAGSFRLAVDEVPEMIETLRAGLDATYRHAPTRRSTGRRPTAGEIA